ncbi:MAG: hypothetical protein ACOYOU_12140 [Kiritimatiellia bacterium]
MICESLQVVSNGVGAAQIYRGHSILVPLAKFTSCRTNDLLQSEDRVAFDARLAGLKTEDVAGGIELANWAMTRGLRLQALALLHRLRTSHAEHTALASRLTVPPAPASLADVDRRRLEELVQLYFASPTNREPVLRALRDTDAIPLSEINPWADLAFAAARGGPVLTVGDSLFRNGELSGQVHVELWNNPPARPATNVVPADPATPAPPGTADKWPVLVALHGGGEGDGSWQSGGPTFFSLFRKHFDRMIFVAPTVMQKHYAEWGSNTNEEVFVRELLKAVKRTWPVDTDRIFLAGVSMGGYGTWHIGGHEADTFAGLVSNAGGILLGFARGETWGWGTIGNLMHTPIAFVHGGKDEQAPPWSDVESDRILTALAAEHPGLYRHKYIFYPSAGHGVPGEGVSQAVDWVSPFVRTSTPTQVIWEPSRPFHRNFYWLRVDQPRMFTRLEASVADNTFKLRVTNLNGGISVWLDPRLVDLKKPVTILVDNQVVFRSLVRPTLSAILESVDDKLDPQMWYPARIDL